MNLGSERIPSGLGENFPHKLWVILLSTSKALDTVGGPNQFLSWCQFKQSSTSRAAVLLWNLWLEPVLSD